MEFGGATCLYGWLRVRGLNWNEQNSTKIYRWILMIAASILLCIPSCALDLMLSVQSGKRNGMKVDLRGTRDRSHRYAIDGQSVGSLSLIGFIGRAHGATWVPARALSLGKTAAGLFDWLPGLH